MQTFQKIDPLVMTSVYHLAPSKLKSSIFLCPYANPLCLGALSYERTIQQKLDDFGLVFITTTKLHSNMIYVMNI